MAREKPAHESQAVVSPAPESGVAKPTGSAL